MCDLIYQPLLYCYLLIGLLIPKKQPDNVNHPLHVSTTNVNFNAQEGKLELTCTVFTDDFESAIAKQYKVKTDLSKPDMHAAMDGLVKNYISNHVQIKTNDKALTLNYLGFEVDREAVNVYLESNKILAFKKVSAEISILHNLYDDQINIVHITENGTRKSTKLEYPETKVSQSF